ncbi:hypothetical protein C3492_05665 [Streptomyces sp. Ru62]|uniref:hypothetical protein n=1 Tax=Streptomyces sp. Ru62 TaxID=2080745 RepID=UPI000CDE1817|nr:hypothetical protein [Streptomyces sp. Ru62]POX64517.1 hypothetical protein C3492_05665 [Streptomyces sp. Ru62]
MTKPPEPPAPPQDLREVVGVEHECKWELPLEVYRSGPEDLLRGGPLHTRLTPLRRPLSFVSSTLYVDDAARSLIRAGHTLGAVVNTGAAADVCWLTFKQAIRVHAWRDGLELASRITPDQVPRALDDSSLLPVGHVRRNRLAEGPLGVAAVATQRRTKGLGRTADGVEVACSVDLVTFRAPEDGRTVLGEYACVEIEVNSSAPNALRALAGLATDMDHWLARPRARRTKAQLALDAAEPAGRQQEDAA